MKCQRYASLESKVGSDCEEEEELFSTLKLKQEKRIRGCNAKGNKFKKIYLFESLIAVERFDRNFTFIRIIQHTNQP